MSARAVRLLALVIGLVLLGGCDGLSTASEQPGAIQVAGSPTRVPVSSAWHTDLRPLTQPRPVGGAAVLLARAPAGASVVSLDPDTGRELWRREVSPSATPADPLAVTAVGGRVAYLVPVAGEGARIEVADARTGAMVAQSPVRHFTTSLRTCGARLCGEARTWAEATAVPYVFDPSTGAFTRPRRGLPTTSRVLEGGGLTDLGRRNPERLGVYDGPALRWSMPVVAYFAEHDSVDAGWRFEQYAGTWVGSLGQVPVPGEPTDLGEVATAAMRADTGRIEWSQAHTTYACLRLVPGIRGVPFRCRWDGERLPGGGYRDLEVVLEGFDPADGRTTWQTSLGAAVGFASGRTPPRVVGPHRIRVTRADGTRVDLDLRTGAESRPGPPALCPRQPWLDGRPGDALLAPCLAAGQPNGYAIDRIGVPFGDLRLLAGPSGVTAWRVGTSVRVR